MASCLSFAGLRLIGRVAALPRPATSVRRVAHAFAPRPAIGVGLLPHVPLSRRRAPLCAAAKAGKDEAEDEEETKASKKKEPVVWPAKLPAALLFDCDGVLADTEKDGHRVCFNAAFKAKGLKVVWEVEEYHKLLQTGGGKERMKKYFMENLSLLPAAARSNAGLDALVGELHTEKTQLFTTLVAKGGIAPRPGVARLMNQALDAGVKVAVCSTSNEAAVQGVLKVVLGDRAKEVRIFAGDVVKNKKPAPDVYLLAARELGVMNSECVVIEDTEIGCTAAKSARMLCVVTYNGYTRDEDFVEADADAVFDGIGELGQENFELGDLTVPNGAFWVDDEGINVDEKDDGVVVKSSKKRRSKKKAAGDSEDDE